MPLARSRSTATSRTWPTMWTRREVRGLGEHRVGELDGGQRRLLRAPRVLVLERRSQLAGRGGQLADGRGDLGRCGVVESHRPDRAARKRSHVLDGEPDLAHRRHVALEPVELAAAAERDARGVARRGEARRQAVVERVEPRHGRQRALGLALVALLERVRYRGEHRGEAVEHGAEALAHEPDHVHREEQGAHGQRRAAPHQGVEGPVEVEALGRLERGHQHRGGARPGWRAADRRPPASRRASRGRSRRRPARCPCRCPPRAGRRSRCPPTRRWRARRRAGGARRRSARA